jgi:hypothetical protein
MSSIKGIIRASITKGIVRETLVKGIGRTAKKAFEQY